MICNTSAINFPWKYLKDVLPRDVFAWSPTGSPMTRVCMNSDWSKFIIMDMNMQECWEPKEEYMEKRVYMFKAIVNISMLDREEPKQKGS